MWSCSARVLARSRRIRRTKTDASSARIRATCTAACAPATRAGRAPCAPVPRMPQMWPATRLSCWSAANPCRTKPVPRWLAPITGIAFAGIAFVIRDTQDHFVSARSAWTAIVTGLTASVASACANMDGRARDATVPRIRKRAGDPLGRSAPSAEPATAASASARMSSWASSAKLIRKRTTSCVSSTSPAWPAWSNRSREWAPVIIWVKSARVWTGKSSSRTGLSTSWSRTRLAAWWGSWTSRASSVTAFSAIRLSIPPTNYPFRMRTVRPLTMWLGWVIYRRLRCCWDCWSCALYGGAFGLRMPGSMPGSRRTRRTGCARRIPSIGILWVDTRFQRFWVSSMMRILLLVKGGDGF